MTALAAKPSHVEWQKYRFLIMDAPRTSNLHLYLRECKNRNVTDIVRVCEPTYEASEVEAAGISMHVRFAVASCVCDALADIIACRKCGLTTETALLMISSIPGLRLSTSGSRM